MRLIVDIEDADRGFVEESRQVGGDVIMFHAPGRAVRAKIIGCAVPEAVAGHGDRYKAYYEITLLDGMTGSLCNAWHDSLTHGLGEDYSGPIASTEGGPC